MIRYILLFAFVGTAYAALANDTLLFKINLDWKKTYDNNQIRYMRKAVLKDSGWLGLDYTLDNRLFHKGYYTDTTFENGLYRHEYLDTMSGRVRRITYYENYQIHLNIYFDEKGDTLGRDLFKNVDHGSFLAESKDYRTGIIRIIDTPLRFIKVDIESEFPGGMDAWQNYLINHIRYPRKARNNKIEGTVIVEFIIDKDGSVSNLRVVKHVDPLLDEEAIRLIGNSPNWKPAKRNQQNVISYKMQSLTFKLPDG